MRIEDQITGWTFKGVEDRLIEAMRMWWHVEGAGWPFASDGPWHLIRDDRTWDWDNDKWADAPLPKLPLSQEQVRRRDEATAWLRHAPERDRRLVVLGVTALAAGRKRVPFRALLRPMGKRTGAEGLRKRYSRAVTCICNALNGAEMRA
ncbi:MAG: hypothetical protein U9R64_12300 [Pseudomonadota bacterium]|nr:hypothetical protein [Pseudomonadota bacterium]